MNVNGPKVDNHLRITDEPSNLYLTQITNAQASSSASTALAVDQRPRGVTMTILWLPPTESTSSPRCPLEPTKWVSDELHQMTCLLMQLTKPNECKTLCRLSRHLLALSFQTIDELDSGKWRVKSWIRGKEYIAKIDASVAHAYYGRRYRPL